MQNRSFFRLDSLKSLQIFQLLRFSSLIIVSIVFARLIPDKNLIGFYEKLLLIGGVSTSFWVSGIINPLLPFYKSISRWQQRTLICNAVMLLTYLSLLCFAILSFLRGVIVHSHQDLYTIYLFFNLFNAPAFLTEYILLLHERPKILLQYGIITFILQTLALSVPVFWDRSMQMSLYLLAFSAILRYTFLLVYVVIHFGKRVHWVQMGIFVKRILPYLFALIIGSSLSYVDSLFINYYYSEADFAVFRYGARELFFVLLMANAFSNAQSAELAAQLKNGSFYTGLSAMRKESEKLMHLLFPVTFLLLLISKAVFTWVYTPAFTASAWIFNIYLLLIVSRLLFPQTVLLALQKNKLLFRASLIEWVANICLDVLFLYLFGMQGIAFATVIAYLLEKAILAWYCSREGFSIASIIPVKTWLLYTCLTAGFYAVSLWIG